MILNINPDSPGQSMPDTDLSIIIVNWNSIQVLRQCLNSIQLCQDSISYEVWVIDNASTDNSLEVLNSEFSWVKILRNSENMGFAFANNQAALNANGRYLLFLNPDTQILPTTIPTMIQYADSHPEIGCLGPRIVNSAGSHQRSCWRNYPGLLFAFIDTFYLWKMSWLPIVKLSEYSEADLTHPCDVDHLLGACLLIPLQAWQQVGPFDDDYFLFFEETEWCYRAKRNGWRIIYFPEAEIVHYGQYSSRQLPGENLPHYYRSYIRFYKKQHPQRTMAVSLLKALIAVSAIIRIGLWKARIWRAENDSDRQLGKRMEAGYNQVLRSLSTY